MKRQSVLVLAVVATLCVAFSNVRADIFDDGGVHNIDFTIADSVYTYDSAVGESTTLNLLPGRVISGHLETRDHSIVHLSGGTIANVISAHYFSHITFENISMSYSAFANQHTQFDMLGGTIGLNLMGYQDSILNIYGGSLPS